MEKKNSTLFMFISITFVTCLLISNIVAFKLITLGPWVLTAGVLLFPITYIINDLVAEVYGYDRAKKVIWFGFGMNLLMVAYFAIAIALPHPVFFTGQAAFATVLGGTWRILLASLSAYLVGSFTNAFIMSKMKVATQGRFLMARAVISTLFGEMFDSTIFVLIAFLGLYDINTVVMMIFTQTAVKTLYEILIFPVTATIIAKVKKAENLDTYDKHISYNPFSINR